LRVRLNEHLDVLRSGAADLPERQRTLMSTIEWSYDLLTRHQQSLLRAFSVFAGGSLDSVEGVADRLPQLDSSLVLDDMESLIAKSLVRSERIALGTRFSMLETIRGFALDRLRTDDAEFGAVTRAHASYYADLSNELRANLQGPGRERALALASAGLGNLRSAWTFWVEQRDAARLEELLETLWALNDAQGQYHGALELANDMLDVLGVSPNAADQVRAAALQMSIARAIMAIKGYTTEVEEAFTRALAMQEVSGSGRQFPVLRSLASLYILQAKMPQALEVGRELLEIAEADHVPIHLVDAHLVIGSTVGFMDAPQGLHHLDAAIAAFDPGDAPAEGLRLGPHPGVISLCASSFLLWFLGHLERADARAVGALDAARGLDHPYSIAFALYHVALLHLWNHQLDRVSALSEELLSLARTHQWSIWEALGVMLDGVIEVASGQPDDGLAAIERGIGIYESTSAPPIFWPLIMNIRAAAFLMANRPVEAEQMADIALAALSTDIALFIPSAIAKGDALLAQGQPAEAKPWYEKALEVGEVLSMRTPQLLAMTRLVGVDPSSERRTALASLLESWVEGRDHPLVQDGVRVVERAFDTEV
jgi:tetratricopeptide (TPR) repeat protein